MECNLDGFIVNKLCELNWTIIFDIPPGFQIANPKTRRRTKNLEGCQRLAKFAENFQASPFNKHLLNQTTISVIHLTGQYLEGFVNNDMNIE
jgi:hypothetical protein